MTFEQITDIITLISKVKRIKKGKEAKGIHYISVGDYTQKDVTQKLDQIILNKLSEKDMINDDFKEGKQEFSLVDNGFEVLDIFIRQCNPLFATTPVIAETIPKFSDHDDLYEYCIAVKLYYIRHKLDGIDFSNLKRTESFLYHM